MLLVTHFHLDHCGALPWLLHKVGNESLMIISFMLHKYSK